MRPDDLGAIASAIAGLLRREQVSGGRRMSRSGAPTGAGRKPKKRRSRRPAVGPLASEISALLRSHPSHSDGQSPRDFDRMVALIASEVVARVAPDQQRQDLPLQAVEI